MATDDSAPLTSEDAFVSLYRRYRPGRFSELRGQDHVVMALQSAVRDGHVAHAYLFSGPRGTGKTSTARILAKALNCLNTTDGDPCGECPSCMAIARGNSMDVTELDAASNNGVDDVRDLIAHASLGSPGRRKVYIIDEVHMLSNAAANALLKTLEEPPGHVVFVLATTDPQKVPATIRSRTQHLEFRLLGAEVLEGLLKDIRDDAGLALDDEIVSLAVRKGKGSARDALSALDQVAASGETSDGRPAFFGEIVDGLALEEPARALTAMTQLREVGYGPQQLAVELIDDLRQAFLLKVAPDLAEVTGADRDRLGEQAEQLGLARIVRAIEVVGRSLVDMRDAPDPLVVLEVAVIRCARADVDAGTSGLLDRLAKLERKVTELSMGGGTHAPSTPSAPAPAPQRATVPEGQKPALGAFAQPRSQRRAAAAPVAETPPSPDPVEQVDEAVSAHDLESPPVPSVDPTSLTAEEVLAAWSGPVLNTLSGANKARFSVPPVRFENGKLIVTMATEKFRETCAEHIPTLSAALAARFGDAVTLEVEVGESGKQVDGETGLAVSEGTPTANAAVEVVEDFGDIDLEEFENEAVPAAGNVATDKILEAFPGAVEENQ